MIRCAILTPVVVVHAGKIVHDSDASILTASITCFPTVARSILIASSNSSEGNNVADRILCHSVDVADDAAMSAAAVVVHRRFGAIDAVIASAGVSVRVHGVQAHLHCCRNTTRRHLHLISSSCIHVVKTSPICKLLSVHLVPSPTVTSVASPMRRSSQRSLRTPQAHNSTTSFG
jgi:NAD(P)-dependent dehydrogenase (short-subunit alcohol dehydrogenase family)